MKMSPASNGGGTPGRTAELTNGAGRFQAAAAFPPNLGVSDFLGWKLLSRALPQPLSTKIRVVLIAAGSRVPRPPGFGVARSPWPALSWRTDIPEVPRAERWPEPSRAIGALFSWGLEVRVWEKLNYSRSDLSSQASPRLGVVAHACHLSTRRLRQENLEWSPAWAIQRDK